MPTSLNNSNEYIDSVEYKKLEDRLRDLKSVLDDLTMQSADSRKLRYAEVDIESERNAGRIQPDELYVPQHIIDTNIRNEQSSYVQFITQSPRAVILEDQDDQATDLALLEKDLTKKLRFDGWQLSMYANIDAFQANGYSVMEVVQDPSTPGEIGHEMVQFGDFAFICDTRDLQAVEMTARSYYYTKTKLLSLCDPSIAGRKPEDVWDKEQVDKVVGNEGAQPTTTSSTPVNSKEKSLYKIQKVMFRVKGVVMVGWTSIGVCDDWMRKPRPLFLGRRQLLPENPAMRMLRKATGKPAPSKEQYETQYPYFLYPYLISENDTISQLKGRVYLDQDVQEAVSSLLSSTVTQARRAAGMYFSKETSDPNDDILQQKNIFFRSGCIINSKVGAFKLDAPDPGIFNAINLLVSGNKAETSQVNFAEKNTKDSRKTAAAIKSSDSKAQSLSTVQVVLFSIALKQQYTYQCEIVKSRVMAGLIKVSPQLGELYGRKWTVKPSGDTDVIEKQKLIETMMEAWPVIQTTAAAPLFLADLLEKMFPDNAPKYIKMLQDAMAQQNSAQAQMMEQIKGVVTQMGDGIINLSKHKEMFSETGIIHAYPVIQHAAQQMEQLEKQMKSQQKVGAQ